MTTHTDPPIFANPERPTVREMVEVGLPKPQAQALYIHYRHARAMRPTDQPYAYDLAMLVRMLVQANRDMES